MTDESYDVRLARLEEWQRRQNGTLKHLDDALHGHIQEMRETISGVKADVGREFERTRADVGVRLQALDTKVESARSLLDRFTWWLVLLLGGTITSICISVLSIIVKLAIDRVGP